MGDKKSVKRLDTIDFARWMSVPFTRTTDGFLTGRAIVTSIGVFTYRNKDGSVSRELKLPEEVFDGDSLDTMKLKPLTLDHPNEKVTPGNVDELQVGSLGSNPTNMTINREDAIDQVLKGKRSLSMGYECDLELAEPGSTWCGMSYDGIQRKIRYNHCAIVDVARAGDAAKIRMDSADAVLINQPNSGGQFYEEDQIGQRR